MKFSNALIKRYFLFITATVLMFGALFYKLYDLQVINADQYQQTAQNSSFKTIRLTSAKA